MIPKIGLDAGHGLYTPGKQTPDGIKEWSLNDDVCDIITDILSGYNCEIIRTDNNEGKTDEPLSERVRRYINAGVSAFVSIHHNAYTGSWNSATGVEVYTDRAPTAADEKLAKLIYDKLVEYTGLKGRGIKKANFQVINQNKIPAVLCEGGFMDGTFDYKVITSATGKKAYARAVAEGLIEFLNLDKKENNSIKVIPKIVYQVHDRVLKKWLPPVTGYDINNAKNGYAGIIGHPIDGIKIKCGGFKYYLRAHQRGDYIYQAKWLPEISGDDYAGNIGNDIDAVMFEIPGLTCEYKVHDIKLKKWLPPVTGYDINNAKNGYAGIIGHPIDGFALVIKG